MKEQKWLSNNIREEILFIRFGDIFLMLETVMEIKLQQV
jgi:hypothetical protein